MVVNCFPGRKNFSFQKFYLHDKFFSDKIAPLSIFSRRKGETSMFEPGNLIIYSGEGVCRVERVGPLEMSGSNPSKLYYTLQPVYR